VIFNEGVIMNKTFAFLLMVFLMLLSLNLYAQTSIEMTEPKQTGSKQIENKISAVKNANPGDYILLPLGNRYTLTKEEIAIVRGEFNYEDLSDVETTVESDGTEIKTISQGHIAYIYPDGQLTHILKTTISFTAYMRYVKDTYFLAQYIDYFEMPNEYMEIDPPAFTVFRSSVQYQILSDGIEDMQALTITIYNYDNINRMVKYCSKPDMIWGYITERGAYKPIGESRQIEFDFE
jgi:hypothetical protein